VEGLDAFEGLVGVFVPERKPGDAVFEECLGGFECEGACSTGN
jgi:hypothetical protein